MEATFLSSGATCEWNLSNVAGVYLKQLRVVLPCLIMTPEREKRVLGYVSAVSRLQAGPLPNQCLPGQGAPTNRLSFWLDWRVRCIEGSALQLDKRARFHPGVHIGGGWIRYQKVAAEVLLDTSTAEFLEALPTDGKQSYQCDCGMLKATSNLIAAGLVSSSFYTYTLPSPLSCQSTGRGEGSLSE